MMGRKVRKYIAGPCLAGGTHTRLMKGDIFMKKQFSAIGLLLCCIVLISCTPSVSSVSNDNSSSFSIALSESSDEVTSTSEVVSSRARPIRTTIETVSEGDEYAQYKITSQLAHIKGYRRLEDGEGTYSYLMCLPHGYVFDTTSIRNVAEDRKVGEVLYSVQLRTNESFLDLFDASQPKMDETVPLETGEYTSESARTVYYEMAESTYNGYRCIYTYLIVMEDGIAASITFYTPTFSREKDEPFFKEIVETFEPI